MFDKIAKIKIRDFAVGSLSAIEVAGGKCRYNFYCHANSVNDAIENEDNRIAMCIYFEDDFPILHVINVDKEGNFTDNTLGVWAAQYKYYLVRFIEKDSFFDIFEIFTAYRKELKSKIPWYIRLFSNYKP